MRLSRISILALLTLLTLEAVAQNDAILVQNKDRIKGLFLTHGHEDHIGGVPYLLKEIDVPVYGTKLTLTLLEHKNRELGVKNAKLYAVEPKNLIKAGAFLVEPINVNHSIPGAVALSIQTPIGTVLHSGDFKVDLTPIGGEIIDIARLTEIGKRGVLLMLCESTNVERQGYSMSETVVTDNLERLFSENKNRRIIIATFASNIHRVQQLINASVRYGRKVAVSGRSMENIVEVASLLGYMDIPEGTLIPIGDIKKYPPHKVTICTTGSQGETMSALSRMAFSGHKNVEITQGDLIVISASPIPGNEKLIFKVIDELFKLGADVIYKSLDEVHVSGHACQEELKIMLGITRPKYFMPIHGDFRHLKQHGILAEKMGIPTENIFTMDVGQVLEIDDNGARIAGNVPSGKVLVDGLGIGDVGNIVLRDRRHLAQDGLIVIVVTMSAKTREIVAGPDIISRGFVYVRESEDLMEEIKSVSREAIERSKLDGTNDWTIIKTSIKNELASYLYSKTKRNPMLLPVIMEV